MRVPVVQLLTPLLLRTEGTDPRRGPETEALDEKVSVPPNGF